MGVHSLWSILEPSSRAVRLESLSRKRLAVDASIWIYQFLKAVRDKSGNSLNSSHIVGFFRRICKLLYFGILPVFVFDGGAPALKRETISKRKERRQGKRENATRTAQRLLAIELQKKSEIQTNKRSNTSPSPQIIPESKDDEDPDLEYRYFEEFSNPTPKINDEAKETDVKPAKDFKGTDEYELPEIEGFDYKKSDLRLSNDEFKDVEEYFDELEGIDLNTIDPGSKEFEGLPLTTQYMVLSQLRLRSRLRMGYTKEQLVNYFPSSLEFSKFQIQMVQKRNYFTQRLMNISGMDDSKEYTRRVAGEKDREYKIEKTEGGWSLSLDEGTNASNAVVVEKEGKEQERRVNDDEDDIEWEDVEFKSPTKKKPNYSISALPLPPADQLGETNDSSIRAFMAYSPQKKRDKNMKKYTDSEDSEDETLRQLEEIELMDAIQESKKEYKKEVEFLENHKRLSPPPANKNEEDLSHNKEKKTDAFEDAFSEDVPFVIEEDASNMFNVPQPKIQNDKLPVFNQEKMTFKNMDSLLGLKVTDKKKSSDDSTIHEDEPQMETKKAEIPAWFKENFPNPHNLQSKESIVPDKTDDNFMLPWNEAKELLEKRSKKNDEQTGIEVIEIANDTEKSNEVSMITDDAQRGDDSHTSSPKDVEGLGQGDNPAPVVVEYDFYESEEEEIAKQLEKEEEEHGNFQKDLNPHMITRTFIEDEKALKDQKRREMRDADEVTVTMIREVQELLARFGIPYITAPMEAEAQCAELLQLGLVDGIITDDSDVFLFGGDKVYRNMFHEKQYVEYYSAQDIERELGLTRSKLIEIAHLLGSDYTEGLKGIGPVSGMEILAYFNSLEAFREWFIEGQFDIGKQKEETSFLRGIRRKILKNNIVIDQSFPDKRIDHAYLQPEVEKDRTDFVWGTPDLDRLRRFLISSVGWSQERVDQVLVPLIQDINRKKREGVQSTLGEFYPVDSFNQKKARGRGGGKRMTQAKGRILSAGKRQKTR